MGFSYSFNESLNLLGLAPDGRGDHLAKVTDDVFSSRGFRNIAILYKLLYATIQRFPEMRAFVGFVWMISHGVLFLFLGPPGQISFPL